MQVATGGLTSGLSKATGGITSFAANAKSKLGSVVDGFARVGLAINGIKSIVSGVASVISTPLQLAASAEQTAVSFEVLLGSADKAKTVLDQLRQFGAETPFEFPELADAGKKLIAFGYDANQLVPSMRRLGDISAGLGVPFGELAEMIGKMKVSGRIMGEDINQLLGRGIPIVGELAKQFGVSEGEVKKLVSEGKVGFPNIEQAIVAMTSEGGKFGGMMAKQSQTMAGLWSTLADNAKTAITSIGQGLIDAFNLKGVTALMSEWIGNSQSMLDGWIAWTKTGIATVVAYATPILKTIWDGFVSAIQWVQPVALQWFNTLTSYVTMLAEVFWSGWQSIVEVVGWAFNSMSGFLPSWDTIQRTITNALLNMEFYFKHWKDYVELNSTQAVLSVVRFANQTVYFFTQVVPATLVWFVDNWKDIFKTLWSYTWTFFKNLATNIVKIISNIPGLIRGSVSFGDLWTPLTEGAVNSIKELPNIPERVMGDLEKNLQSDVDRITGNLGKQWEEFKAERDKTLYGPEAVKVIEPKIVKAAQQAATPTTTPTAVTPAVARKQEYAGLAEYGSQEARQTILRNLYGKQSDTGIKGLNQVGQSQLTELKKMNQKLDSIKSNTESDDEEFDLDAA